jgi:hypothetical protein
VHAIACRSVVAGVFLQENEVIAVEHGGQHRKAPWILALFLCARQAPVHIVPIEITIMPCFTSYACVDCALRIGFLDDGDKLHGSTLPYTILDVVVLLL